MNNQASFTVSYDGEALKTHSMDVRDLSAALLSFASLFTEANRVLNNDEIPIKVAVKALSSGSFEITFEIVQGIASQISHFLTGDVVTSAVNLKDLIAGSGFAACGLFALIKWMKGGKPTKITDLKNGFVKIEFDEKTFDVPKTLLQLYQDLSVRTAIEKTLQPLNNDGIDSFSIRDGTQEIENITKMDSVYFIAPGIEDELIMQTEHEDAYSIISLAFKDDNKWRLFDGNATINAVIKDEDFLNKINDNKISFTKGDILLCKIKVSKWKTNIGLKSNYEVLKIIEHKKSLRQISLFNDQT